ncbi:MAG: asparagine synthase (glutamine-hydrolyzing) [Acidobacteria bacterium]|nr:asparagine synthase (glutamine-hydrolyzing) [Acidobacteriota bacterium]
MCGIAGIWRWGGAEADWLTAQVSRMARTLVHRGPDGGGIWVNATAGVALGHRRLKVIDLTEAGHQPMVSASGRYVITFNGEIYNFAELRRALRNYPYRSMSDTEVMLASFERWGVEGSIPALDGMFAFAVWDRRDQNLTLARDRLGEKPLYYRQEGRTCWFGSELKALPAGDIDDQAQAEFLERGYIGAPRTIYQGTYKLQAAHWLRLGEKPRRYWELPLQPKFSGSREAAAEQLDALLKEAVRSRQVADVPVGAFLSGGVDSSSIVAMAPGTRTFTIGFEEASHDESAAARAVAQVLGTQHTELLVTAREAMAVIPDLPSIYDEPFADSSQIPSVLVSRLARAQVTVALAGDGGDELFAGYPRYHQIEALASVPWLLRQVASPLVSRWAKGEKAELLASAMSARNLGSLYAGVMGGESEGQGRDAFDWMARHDLRHYFCDDLLVKLDRASMEASLEVRLPFLEPRLVAFALSLPGSIKSEKRVLRDVLAKYVPRQLFERPKQGFSVPLAQWLCGPLLEWAEELVPGATRGLQPGDRCVRLWSRLMLEAWRRARPLSRPEAHLPGSTAARD